PRREATLAIAEHHGDPAARRRTVDDDEIELRIVVDVGGSQCHRGRAASLFTRTTLVCGACDSGCRGTASARQHGWSRWVEGAVTVPVQQDEIPRRVRYRQIGLAAIEVSNSQ